MLFGQFARLVKVRFWVIVMVFLAVLGTAIAASLLMAKRYTATTSMVLDFQSNDPILGGSAYLQGTIAGFLATQVDIIRSERVVKLVLDRLALEKNPRVIELYEQSPKRDPIRVWVSGEISRSLVVEPSREGAVLNLSVDFFDGQIAADIANAFAQAFVDVTLDMKTEPAKNYAAAFEQQARRYREELQQAQGRLSEFQQRTGITATDERYDVENVRLQELSSEQLRIQALASESRSRADAVGRSGREVMPEAVTSPQVAALRTDLSRAEARYEEASARLGLNHPQIVAVQAEISGLKSRLEAELSRVSGSIGTGNSINQQREAQIRAALEAQRAKVLALKKQRDQIAVLQREVDAAQRSIELLNTRVTQTTLESRARQSNVNIVSPAFAPGKPSRPQPVLNAIVGAFAGLLLGLIAAITLEKIQRPIRDATDMLDAVGVPILAVLPSANSNRPRRLIGSTGPVISPALRLGRD
jgi:chain length determinant protein EpsF